MMMIYIYYNNSSSSYSSNIYVFLYVCARTSSRLYNSKNGNVKWALWGGAEDIQTHNIVPNKIFR
jgi:hypothetical protein